MRHLPDSSIGAINILDESGHRQVTWNTSNTREVAAAQKTFDRLVRHGYAAFGAALKAGPKQSMTAFDPAMEEIVMVPRIVGG